MFLSRFTSFLMFAGVLFSWNLTAEELVHIVSRGETIYSISRFYRIGSDELMKENGISDPSRLQVGRKLVIPSSAFSNIPDSPVSASGSSGVPVLADYRIVRGDTLFSIARTNGITLQQLLDMNKFSSNHVIRTGDVIKIPGRNTAAAGQNNPAQTANIPAAARSGNGLLSLRWPVNARGIAYMTGQMGVVVEGELNESVRSLTNGRVISAGPWRKFGKVAIVEAAGGYFYMYGGCETLSVNVGDRISAGTELGRLGTNTVSEKAQLFLMVFRNDAPVDPARAPRAGGNINI